MEFTLEVARTLDERRKGLSGRDSLKPRSGMLFMGTSGSAPSIWMKQMQFPLDLVWISRDCTVVEITPSVAAPAPGTPSADLPRYTAAPPAAHAFEINAGEAETRGIGVGDPVRFVGVRNETGGACE